MAKIHPAAIVNPQARLAEGVEIGPYAIIESSVSIGPGTSVAARAFIGKNTTIGSDCRIHPGAVVGHEPQMLRLNAAGGSLVIGNNNVIREYCTIHRSTRSGHSTVIGDHNFLMAFSHVAHDCRLGNHVVLCNGSLLAGHVAVDDYAFISGNVSVHQFARIGKYAMIGGLARVARDVPPYMLVKGDSEIWSINVVGLKRANFSSQTRAAIKAAFKVIFKSGLNLRAATESLQKKSNSAELQELINFITRSRRGICNYRRRGIKIGIPFSRRRALGYRFFSELKKSR